MQVRPCHWHTPPPGPLPEHAAFQISAVNARHPGGYQRLLELTVVPDLCSLQNMSLQPQPDQRIVLSLSLAYCLSCPAFFALGELHCIQVCTLRQAPLSFDFLTPPNVSWQSGRLLGNTTGVSFSHLLKVTWMSTGTSPAGSAHSCDSSAEGTAGGCGQEEGGGRGPEGGRHEDGPGCRSRHGRAWQWGHEVQRPTGQTPP